MGYGVRATQSFSEGEPVLTYSGELIDSRCEMEVRKRRYADNGNGNFLFGFPNFRNKWHWLVSHSLFFFLLFLNRLILHIE
jgi:hypothetical protein